MDMNGGIHMKNREQNGYCIQQAPSFRQNLVHNHQYCSYSKENSIISIDELAELNLNSSVNAVAHDIGALRLELDLYRVLIVFRNCF